MVSYMRMFGRPAQGKNTPEGPQDAPTPPTSQPSPVPPLVEISIPSSLESDIESFNRLQQEYPDDAATLNAVDEILYQNAQNFLHSTASLQSALEQSQHQHRPSPPDASDIESQQTPEPRQDNENFNMGFEELETLIDDYVADVARNAEHLKAALRPFFGYRLSRAAMNFLLEKVRRFHGIFSRISDWVFSTLKSFVRFIRTARIFSEISMGMVKITTALIEGGRLAGRIITRGRMGSDGTPSLALTDLPPV